MGEMDEKVERVAKAIYDAWDPLSDDSIATVIMCSDHLFPKPEHFEGHTEPDAYRLATMDVCRTIARAAIEAIGPLPAPPSQEEG